MQHIDDHDPIGNEVLSKRALASPTRSKRKMKAKPKKTTKKAKVVTKPPATTPTLQPVAPGQPAPKQGKGKLPPWLVKFQKKSGKVKKRG